MLDEGWRGEKPSVTMSRSVSHHMVYLDTLLENEQPCSKDSPEFNKRAMRSIKSVEAWLLKA